MVSSYVGLMPQVAASNWGRWSGHAPPQLVPAATSADVSKYLHVKSAGYSAMPLDALPAGIIDRPDSDYDATSQGCR